MSLVCNAASRGHQRNQTSVTIVVSEKRVARPSTQAPTNLHGALLRTALAHPPRTRMSRTRRAHRAGSPHCSHLTATRISSRGGSARRQLGRGHCLNKSVGRPALGFWEAEKLPLNFGVSLGGREEQFRGGAKEVSARSGSSFCANVRGGGKPEKYHSFIKNSFSAKKLPQMHTANQILWKPPLKLSRAT